MSCALWLNADEALIVDYSGERNVELMREGKTVLMEKKMKQILNC